MDRSMLNITYKDRKTNICVRQRTTVIDIISNVRKMKSPGQCTSAASKTTDGHRVSYPSGDTRGQLGVFEPVGVPCPGPLHHVESIRQDKMIRETSQVVERRPGQILEWHGLTEDSTIQANLETAWWGLRPTTGPHGCTMMLMMNCSDTMNRRLLFIQILTWIPQSAPSACGRHRN